MKFAFLSLTFLALTVQAGSVSASELNGMPSIVPDSACRKIKETKLETYSRDMDRVERGFKHLTIVADAVLVSQACLEGGNTVNKETLKLNMRLVSHPDQAFSRVLVVTDLSYVEKDGVIESIRGLELDGINDQLRSSSKVEGGELNVLTIHSEGVITALRDGGSVSIRVGGFAYGPVLRGAFVIKGR